MTCKKNLLSKIRYQIVFQDHSKTCRHIALDVQISYTVGPNANLGIFQEIFSCETKPDKGSLFKKNIEGGEYMLFIRKRL